MSKPLPTLTELCNEVGSIPWLRDARSPEDTGDARTPQNLVALVHEGAPLTPAQRDYVLRLCFAALLRQVAPETNLPTATTSSQSPGAPLGGNAEGALRPGLRPGGLDSAEPFPLDPTYALPHEHAVRLITTEACS